MGGGDERPSYQAPPAPSATETTREAIQGQVSSLPDIYRAQQEYGPKFSQLELDQMKQFGPQYTQFMMDLERQYGPQLAEQTRREAEILDPASAAGSRYITSYLNESDEPTAAEMAALKESTRAAQSVRGFGTKSGLGAADETRALAELKQQLKTRKIQTALSSAGKIPTQGTQTVGTSYQAPGQMVQNVTPAQTFQLAAGNYATGAGIYGANLNFQNQQSQNSGLFGQIGGGLLGAATGSFGTRLGSGFGRW